VLLARVIAIAIAVVVPLATARAHDPIATRVTWNGEVGRIVRARCVSCHSEGGRGPMPLTSYREARPWATAIKEEVLTRRMPKWHAARGYGAFSNDPSLSPFEIALIAAWADGGAPEGAAAETTVKPGEERARQARVPPGAREIPFKCGGPLPAGTLLAVRPALATGASTGFALVLPERVEVLVWIRDFDPDFATTYWLRAPIALPPGSRLISYNLRPYPGRSCSVLLTMAPLR
jgi:hypothetical protein